MKAQEPELNAIYPAKKRHYLLQLGDELFERDAAIGGSEALSKLISVAAATLDSDRATARACIERAAELLSVSDEARPAPAAPTIRGGLAPWQQKNVDAYVAANIS